MGVGGSGVAVAGSGVGVGGSGVGVAGSDVGVAGSDVGVAGSSVAVAGSDVGVGGSGVSVGGGSSVGAGVGAEAEDEPQAASSRAMTTKPMKGQASSVVMPWLRMNILFCDPLFIKMCRARSPDFDFRTGVRAFHGADMFLAPASHVGARKVSYRAGC